MRPSSDGCCIEIQLVNRKTKRFVDRWAWEVGCAMRIGESCPLMLSTSSNGPVVRHRFSVTLWIANQSNVSLLLLLRFDINSDCLPLNTVVVVCCLWWWRAAVVYKILTHSSGGGWWRGKQWETIEFRCRDEISLQSKCFANIFLLWHADGQHSGVTDLLSFHKWAWQWGWCRGIGWREMKRQEKMSQFTKKEDGR